MVLYELLGLQPHLQVRAGILSAKVAREADILKGYTCQTVVAEFELEN